MSIAFDTFASNARSQYHWVLPAIVIVLAVALVIRSLGPVHHLLASPGAFRLNGHWSGHFEYEKDGRTVRIEEALVISQTGRKVKGQSTSTRIVGNFPLSQATYHFDALVRPDGVLEGTWKNLQIEHRYYGNFLGRVARSGDKIDGNWIGVEDPSTRWGKFTWTRRL